MNANSGTPEIIALITVRKEVHAEPGTPESIAVITVRKEVRAAPGTPENIVVNTVRRKSANGLKREQVGPVFLTRVEQNGVAGVGGGIHVALKFVTEMLPKISWAGLVKWWLIHQNV